MATPHLLALIADWRLLVRPPARPAPRGPLTTLGMALSTTRPTARPRAPGPRRGLTSPATTRRRIAAALAATHSEATRAVYAGAWRHWARWCTGRGFAPLPADPAAVCAYLTERADAGHLRWPPSTSPARPSGTSTAATAWPTRSPTTRCARSAAGCAAPRHRAPPAGPSAERARAPPDHHRHRPQHRRCGVRDTALILLGFAGALRRSELVALTLADLERQARRPAAPPPPFQDRPGSPRPGRRHRPRPARRSPTRSPPSTPGSPSADANPARCSPAYAPGDPR